MDEQGICAICGNYYTHFGNNPEPIKRFEERVCDSCNGTFVIPERMKRMQKRETARFNRMYKKEMGR
jgi:hypothetical protein